MDTLTEQLRQAVLSTDASQADVARHCGLTPSTVSRFLAGKGSLSLQAADKLSRCLRLKVVLEREWERREIIWDKYQTGELRGRWDEF
jgi:transcriptional regulator with XRE-family HTH domain